MSCGKSITHLLLESSEKRSAMVAALTYSFDQYAAKPPTVPCFYDPRPPKQKAQWKRERAGRQS